MGLDDLRAKPLPSCSTLNRSVLDGMIDPLMSHESMRLEEYTLPLKNHGFGDLESLLRMGEEAWVLASTVVSMPVGHRHPQPRPKPSSFPTSPRFQEHTGRADTCSVAQCSFLARAASSGQAA